MPWANWPGTANGISSPAWGTNVQLYVRAAIAAGTNMHWGPGDRSDPTAFLDAGNVWSGSAQTPAPPAGSLWIDVGCDVLDLETVLGLTDANPPANVADAGTAEFTLIDPDRRYDPLNPSSPYTYGGISRLREGAPILIWAEYLTSPSTVGTCYLFRGTVDTWTSDWSPHANARRAKVTASDETKVLASLDWGEQPSVGAGDYQKARMERILTYYGRPLPTASDNGSTRYAATTLADSAWELLSEVMTDGNGFLYIDPQFGVTYRWNGRWTVRNPTLRLQVGCPAPPGVYDILLAVETGVTEIRNSWTASRTGGTATRYFSQSSIDKYGERGYPKRTDLTLYDDAEVATIANTKLQLAANPRGRIVACTIRPQIDQTSWPDVFQNQQYLSAEAMRVYWLPPDAGAVAYDVKARPFGVTHTITRDVWSIRYALAFGDVYSRVMHWGPATYDKLDSGNVYV